MTNYGSFTVTTPGTHRAKIINTHTGETLHDFHGSDAEQRANEYAHDLHMTHDN